VGREQLKYSRIVAGNGGMINIYESIQENGLEVTHFRKRTISFRARTIRYRDSVQYGLEKSRFAPERSIFSFLAGP